MKKLFAMLLAVVMIFSLATVAFAEEAEAPATYNLVSPEKKAAVELNKIYTVTGVEGSVDADVYPHETLTFTVVEGKEEHTSYPDVYVDELNVKSATDQTIYVNIPSYSEVGVYTYTISENKNGNQAVGYTEEKIAITVLVTYDYEDAEEDGYHLASKIVLSTPNGSDKLDTFTNTYDVGNLTVTKTVKGNLASTSAYFKMTVVFTATADVVSNITVSGGSYDANPETIAIDDWAEDNTYTATFWLKHGETLTFENVPAGVTYALAEDAAHILAEGAQVDPNSAADADYTASYTAATGEIKSAATAAAAVENKKETDVATGIVLDSMPYVVILAVACFGMFAMMTKKRYEV